MSQVSDYSLANQGFSAFRTELNNILGAINTLNAGSSAPSSIAAGSLWLDTTNATTPTLKFYDGSDQISLCTFNYSANTVNWLDNSVTADLSGDSSPQLGGNLDTNSHNIIIDDAHYISDENNNEQIIFQTTGSAVNELEITNGATGDGPILGASGETNVDLHIKPKGTGETIIGTGAAAATLTTSGTYDLVLDTNKGTNSSNITITDAANGDVTVNPNGSGTLHVAGNATQAGTIKITEDTDDGSNYVAMKAPNVSTSYTMTLPTAVAAGNDYILKSTTAGVLSWAEASGGGTSWQALKTSGFTAAAGEGYICNTTSAAFTATLPASPSIGDEVTLVDYAGTFDTNNLTVGRNSKPIMGVAENLTVATERAAFTLVFSDDTQGWLLKDK